MMASPASQQQLFAPSATTLEGRNGDIYFRRTAQILDAEGLDPTVAVEIFARRRALLCGMREVHALLAQVVGGDGEVWSLDEGAWFEPREVVLRLRAPYRRFCLYETALLGMLSSGTGWATAAAECVAAAAGIPILSFGARHVHPDVSGRMEYAACVGGCSGCATAWGAELAAMAPSGTLPHALILVFGDTLAAAQAFDRVIDAEVKRIVLVDTFRPEVEETLRVAEAMGEHLWGVRLDRSSERGGVTVELVHQVRQQLDEAGHRHVRIVASGGIDAQQIRHFVEADAPVDAFGVGSAISGAPAVDFTMDVKEVDGCAVAKLGRVPGLIDNPRLARIALAEAEGDGDYGS